MRLWIMVVGAVVWLALAGCTVPRTGFVLDQKAGTYKAIVCETYSRTPVQRDIVLCEVQ